MNLIFRGYPSHVPSHPSWSTLKYFLGRERCSLCGQYGHSQEVGIIVSVATDEYLSSPNIILAKWCEMYPVDERYFTVVR